MLNLKENNLKEKTLESLIRTKLFKSEDELLKEAIDALFYKRPELKREVAVDMYKNKEISLWKAAQMCGVSLEEFKEILRSRGIKIEIEATKQETEKRLKKGIWINTLVILDADIASTLAKVDRINLVEKLFGPQIFISEAVYKELLVIKQEGYDFPIRVFQKARVLSLSSEKEFKDFEGFIENRQIHYGEAESMSLARNRNYVFLTNDAVALNYAQSKDIKVLNLKDILVRIATLSLLSGEEMENFIKDIEEKDSTYIKWKEELFDLYQPPQ